MSVASDSPKPDENRSAVPKLEIVGKGTQTAAAPPAAETAAPASKKGGALRNLVLTLIAAAAIGGGAWYGHGWWTDGRFLVTTEDAYVAADMAILTPKVTGYIQSVPVVENQAVKDRKSVV